MEVEIKVPTVGESITEVTLAKWLKEDGAVVQRDEMLCELESEKATFELSAEQAGKLIRIAPEGAVLKIGDVVCKIDTSVEQPDETAAVDTKKESGPVAETPAKKERAPEATTEKKDTGEKLKEEKPEASQQAEAYPKNIPSPAADKMIRETGTTVDKGSGRDGRITKGDVLTALKSDSKIKKPFSREEHREKMSTLRKTISRRLVAAKNTTAMLTTFNEVDMKPIMDIRNKYKDAFKEKHGVGLGFMSFFTKACCIALQEWPGVNAYLDEDEIIYHDYCDISIAVSTPKGLVTPVIRNAESLSFAEIEKAVADLAKRGRDNKLKLEEMSGGTFTISNGGVFGSLMSTPIINLPQSAILGMHKILERPVAIDAQVVIRPMMYLAVSYDHRVIDGRESVSFLVRVKELLEHPDQLLSGGDPVRMMLGM